MCNTMKTKSSDTTCRQKGLQSGTTHRSPQSKMHQISAMPVSFGRNTCTMRSRKRECPGCARQASNLGMRERQQDQEWLTNITRAFLLSHPQTHWVALQPAKFLLETVAILVAVSQLFLFCEKHCGGMTNSLSLVQALSGVDAHLARCGLRVLEAAMLSLNSAASSSTRDCSGRATKSQPHHLSDSYFGPMSSIIRKHSCTTLQLRYCGCVRRVGEKMGACTGETSGLKKSIAVSSWWNSWCSFNR